MRLDEHLDEQLHSDEYRLQDLFEGEYNDFEVGDIVRDAAALCERTFKAAKPEWAGKPLYDFGVFLRASGVSDEIVDALDRIRRAANRDKHEATPRHDADDVLADLATIRAGLPSIGRVLTGLAGTYSATARRRVYVTVYDYFHAGESELVVFPATATTPRFYNVDIDVVQIAGRRLDEVVAALEMIGEWQWSPPAYQALTEQYEKESSEFYRAASFEGDYRQFIRTVANFQRPESAELLPGLHRADQWSAVRTAMAITACDLWVSGAEPPVAAELVSVAEADFGLPSDRGWTRIAAKEFAGLLAVANGAGLETVRGPRWIRAGSSRWPSEPIALSEQFAVAVGADGTLLLSGPAARFPTAPERAGLA
ncbi:hypothetical protein ND748_00910 [Frankia sp. AiPs1]|uniref:hypothetical protein n=1 Tax=Frankia sp. AiPs1 TaxID=573493 RepID=UPI002044025E|nr:hypothetical protein [Frankia sp. AiPs1]MCM3920249.1 hypothetical protein [Frankia sp. AiPs1]